MGGQTIELRPLTTEEFLELIYISGDVLHEALVDWVSKEETSAFVLSILSKLDKEKVTKLICMFLHVEPEWLEENASANETFEALRQAIGLNNWADVLQVLVILDTLRMEEVIQLWQTVKAASLKK